MSTRYQVALIGNMWHVIDRASDKTIAFRQCYQCAMQYVSSLEARDAGQTAEQVAA